MTEAIDRYIFLLINGANSDVADFLMYWMSSTFIWIPFYAILLFFLFKRFGLKKLLIIIPFIVLMTVTTDQSSVFLKNTFERYRPCHNLELTKQVHLVYDYCGGQFGFPSSHASNTFGLAIIMGLLFFGNGKKAMLFMLLWASLVSYSRIYLGAHYPSDVFVGALLGSVVGTIFYLSCNYSLKQIFHE